MMIANRMEDTCEELKKQSVVKFGSDAAPKLMLMKTIFTLKASKARACRTEQNNLSITNDFFLKNDTDVVVKKIKKVCKTSISLCHRRSAARIPRFPENAKSASARHL